MNWLGHEGGHPFGKCPEFASFSTGAADEGRDSSRLRLSAFLIRHGQGGKVRPHGEEFPVETMACRNYTAPPEPPCIVGIVMPADTAGISITVLPLSGVLRGLQADPPHAPMLLAQRLLERQDAPMNLALFPLVQQLLFRRTKAMLLQGRPVAGQRGEVIELVL